MNIHRLMAILAVLSLGVTAHGVPVAQSFQVTGDPMKQTVQAESTVAGLHDFDFLIGHWQVHHRRLKERLAGSHEWIEFEGTSVMQTVLGGYGNVDDNMMEFPAGAYRGVSLRSFEPASGQWSIWFLDSRMPLGPLDPPVRGRFKDGTGTFLADDTFNGRPIRVRYLWSKITPASCHWEQAFSTDGGITWETNWMMDFKRV
jgi:hypothetical protein